MYVKIISINFNNGDRYGYINLSAPKDPPEQMNYQLPKVKSVNQHHMDFFRLWLLDESGKKFLSKVLQGHLVFEEEKVQQIIDFMEEVIKQVDKRTKELYSKQQIVFIEEYNKGLPEYDKAASYRQIYVDQANIDTAETRIQGQLHDVIEQRVGQLANVIGKQYAIELDNWMLNVIVPASIPTSAEVQAMSEEQSTLVFKHGELLLPK